MKSFGSSVDFTHARNADIMRVFRQKLAEAHSAVRLSDICRLVADSPSSRFWVSEERAAIVIAAMEARRPLAPMRPSKQEMYAEIFRRYLTLRALHPGVSIIELVSIVVNQPAPKFYFTPGSIRVFINRIRNGYYKRSR